MYFFQISPVTNAFTANSSVKYTSIAAAHKSNSATFAAVQTTQQQQKAFVERQGRSYEPLGGRVPPPSSLDRNDLKRVSLRSRAFLLSVLI